MDQEVRPRISAKLKQEVENVHHAATGGEPDSFKQAIATTCALAYEAIDNDLDIEVIDDSILPQGWRIDRLSEDYIQLIDEQLPDSWKQSRLVAERVQTVVYHYLQVKMNDRSLIYATTFDSEDGEITNRAAVKEAMEITRKEENPELSSSAVRSTCHSRLFSDSGRPYARKFEQSLENIQQNALELGLDAPEPNNKEKR